MVVQTAFQEQGALLNTTGHEIGTRDITTFSSNPLLWHLFYVHPDYNKIMGGEFGFVDRVSVVSWGGKLGGIFREQI